MNKSQEIENLVKNLKDSIIISGLDGKLKYISPQYSELIGREVTIGESFGKTMHPDDLKRVTKLFAQALKQGKALEVGERRAVGSCHEYTRPETFSRVLAQSWGAI